MSNSDISEALVAAAVQAATADMSRFPEDPEASAFAAGVQRGINAYREALRTQAVEALADQAHKSWSGWMVYMLGVSTPLPDSSVLIPTARVARWMRQIDAPYSALPSDEQELDRKEARAILDVILGKQQ